MEFIDYQDAPRKTKHAIIRDLSRRVLAIVTERHPDPVLGAEIDAQLTEQISFIDTAEGEPIGGYVHLNDNMVTYAREKAVQNKSVVVGMRGNQLTYRLPADGIEAGHITV